MISVAVVDVWVTEVDVRDVRVQTWTVDGDWVVGGCVGEG